MSIIHIVNTLDCSSNNFIETSSIDFFSIGFLDVFLLSDFTFDSIMLEKL